MCIYITSAVLSMYISSPPFQMWTSVRLKIPVSTEEIALRVKTAHPRPVPVKIASQENTVNKVREAKNQNNL